MNGGATTASSGRGRRGINADSASGRARRGRGAPVRGRSGGDASCGRLDDVLRGRRKGVVGDGRKGCDGRRGLGRCVGVGRKGCVGVGDDPPDGFARRRGCRAIAGVPGGARAGPGSMRAGVRAAAGDLKDHAGLAAVAAPDMRAAGADYPSSELAR